MRFVLVGALDKELFVRLLLTARAFVPFMSAEQRGKLGREVKPQRKRNRVQIPLELIERFCRTAG